MINQLKKERNTQNIFSNYFTTFDCYLCAWGYLHQLNMYSGNTT